MKKGNQIIIGYILLYIVFILSVIGIGLVRNHQHRAEFQSLYEQISSTEIHVLQVEGEMNLSFRSYFEVDGGQRVNINDPLESKIEVKADTLFLKGTLTGFFTLPHLRTCILNGEEIDESTCFLEITEK